MRQVFCIVFIVLSIYTYGCDNLVYKIKEPKSQEKSKQAGIIVLDNIEKRLSLTGHISPPLNIFPGITKHGYSEDVDCLSSYHCVCNGSYLYELIRVSDADLNKLRSRLEAIKQTPLFDCYKVNASWWDHTEQNRCRFVRHITTSKDIVVEIIGERSEDDLTEPVPLKTTTDKQLGWPNINPSGQVVTKLRIYTNQKHKNYIVRELWLENGIREDNKGIPVDNATDTFRPIFIIANNEAFLVCEVIKPHDVSCLLRVYLSNTAFDLSECSNKDNCYDEAITTFKKQIETSFGDKPISAMRVLDQPLPPNEMWMRRQYQVSNILNSPFHEISTYLVKWWKVDTHHGLIRTGMSYPFDDGLRIAINITHSFTRSVGVKGDYKEPEPNEIEKYALVVNSVAKKCLESSCLILKGNMSDGICLLK